MNIGFIADDSNEFSYYAKERRLFRDMQLTPFSFTLDTISFIHSTPTNHVGSFVALHNYFM